MTKEIKILVACGSGVATSTIAQEAVKEIAQRAGVNARVFKAPIAEVPERQHHVDIVLTTANYRQPLEKPYMSVFGLISGVNKANTEKKLEVPGDVNLYHVAPRRDLGGLLGFKPCRANRNMLLGYFDGKRMLYGLAGRAYYIDAPEGETYYFDKMISEIQSLLSYMEPRQSTGGRNRRTSLRDTVFIQNRYFPGWQRN